MRVIAHHDANFTVPAYEVWDGIKKYWHDFNGDITAVRMSRLLRPMHVRVTAGSAPKLHAAIKAAIEAAKTSSTVQIAR